MSPASARISAIVCTYNRCDLTRLALESLCRQTLDPSQYEIILVDDGSPDRTPELAQEFAGRHPAFRYVRQANAGLSAARNAGWRSAVAPLIAYLDDDAIAEPAWLEQIAAAMDRAGERAACAGGLVRLRWEAPRPAWLTDACLRFLSAYSAGSEETLSSEVGQFVGANMTIRRPVLEAIGGFSVALGRSKTSLLSHEESALWALIRARGGASLYVPGAAVDHFVPKSRATRTWFRRRLYWEGVSMALRDRRSDRSWLGRRMSALKHRLVGLKDPMLWQPWRWSGHFDWQLHACYQWGYANGLTRQPA